MHCITTLLFTLSTLSSALTLPPPLSSNPPLIGHQPHQHTYCIQRDTNHQSIFFNHAAEPLFNFTISTRYLRFYPHTITAWLDEKDFIVANASTIATSELCGWLHGEDVLRDGRQHGVVYWKRSHVSDSNSTMKTLPRSALSILGNPRPQDATFRAIRSILYNNTPDADRYYLMTVMLGTACGTLGFMLVFYALAAVVALQQRRSTHKAPDIELDQIKVHELTGAGMQRFDAGRTVERPKATVGGGMAAVSGGNRGVSGRGVGTPPPVYSVDGAAR